MQEADAFDKSCLEEYWNSYVEGVCVYKVRDNDREMQEIQKVWIKATVNSRDFLGSA